MENENVKMFAAIGVGSAISGIFLSLTYKAFAEGDHELGSIYLLCSIVSGLVSGIAIVVFRKTKEPIAEAIILGTQNILDRAKCSWPYFRKRYYQNLASDVSRDGIEGVGQDQLDELEDLFVPLRLLKTPSEDVSSDLLIGNEGDDDKTYDIWHFLKKEDNRRVISILGGPGFGKTTLIKYLTLCCTERKSKERKRLKKTKLRKLTPCLLYLRDIHEEVSISKQLDLAELLFTHNSHPRKELRLPKNWFRRKLEAGDCLIMLDGLDEIPKSSNSNLIGKWVEQQIERYSLNLFIMTSRPLGYKEICEGNKLLSEKVHLHLEVQRFSVSDIHSFVKNWYWCKSEKTREKREKEERRKAKGIRKVTRRKTIRRREDDLIQRMQGNKYILELASNPLLLKLICIIHQEKKNRLPEGRGALYKEIIDLSLEKRMRAKRTSCPTGLSGNQKQAILQHVAFALSVDGERLLCSQSQCIAMVLDKIRSIAPSMKTVSFLNLIKGSSGLIRQPDEGSVEFVHRSFQDYLTAIEIREREGEKLLIDKMGHPWWEEVTYMYIASGDPSNLIITALNLNTEDSIKLAARACKEGKIIHNQRLLNYLKALDINSKKMLSEFSPQKEPYEYYRVLWWSKACRELGISWETQK